jgi:hypothetical protein
VHKADAGTWTNELTVASVYSKTGVSFKKKKGIDETVPPIDRRPVLLLYSLGYICLIAREAEI